jgi:NAD(P)H-dependent FMN reductase
MRLLAISGSLRRDSHNTRLLRVAARLVPPPAELELFGGRLVEAAAEHRQRRAELPIAA